MLNAELLRLLAGVLLVLATKTALLATVRSAAHLTSRRGIVTLATGTLVVVVDVFFGFSKDFSRTSVTLKNLESPHWSHHLLKPRRRVDDMS